MHFQLLLLPNAVMLAVIWAPCSFLNKSMMLYLEAGELVRRMEVECNYITSSLMSIYCFLLFHTVYSEASATFTGLPMLLTLASLQYLIFNQTVAFAQLKKLRSYLRSYHAKFLNYNVEPKEKIICEILDRYLSLLITCTKCVLPSDYE